MIKRLGSSLLTRACVQRNLSGTFSIILPKTAQSELININQFIGEADYINCGIGEKSITMFIQMIVAAHQPERIILDPSPDNKRAIRCYEKVGFTHCEMIKGENGDSAYMMSLDCK